MRLATAILSFLFLCPTAAFCALEPDPLFSDGAAKAPEPAPSFTAKPVEDIRPLNASLSPMDPSPELLDEVSGAIKSIPNPPLTQFHPGGRISSHFVSGLDPLNIIFIGSKRSVRKAFRTARWSRMVNRATASLALVPIRLLRGYILTSLPPMTRQFVAFSGDDGPGKSQDISMAEVHRIAKISRRHHMRCWHMPQRTSDGRDMFLCMANYDDGLKGFTHTISPHIDEERDYILDELRHVKGTVKRFAYTTLAGAREINCNDSKMPENQDGFKYCTDGKTLVVELEKSAGSPAATSTAGIQH